MSIVRECVSIVVLGGKHSGRNGEGVVSKFLELVRDLIRAGDVRISEHGYDELAEDGLTAREVLAGVQAAEVVEEYPNYPKGPCVLVLQKGRTGEPVHVVWAFPKATKSLWFLSLPTAQIQSVGTRHSRGGGDD